MKIFFITFTLIALSSCSFDNKTGIWDNNITDTKTQKNFEGFKKLNTSKKLFDRIIKPDNNLEVILEPVKLNFSWKDEYYSNSNHLDNFSFKNLNELIFKSKKLSRFNTNNAVFYNNENVIISDNKGNIIVYSIVNQKILIKYNFYKKKYKKIKKYLKIIIEKNIIYVGDNLGYLYALDYKNQKLLWAKDYKVPFRSNLKILKNNLLIADNNNTLYFIDKTNGEKVKTIPTEETLIKNEFINSLSSTKDSLFYLNTYGSLYSIYFNGKIKWFVNLNQSLDINPNNLFYSNPIILHQERLVISTDLYLYILNSNTGSTILKIPISASSQPIISDEYIFLVTKDNLLVCINVKSGKINYSIDISDNIASYLDAKKKSINIKFLKLVNNDLFLFLNNSYLVKFTSNGRIKDIVRMPSELSSNPIFINDSIIYLDNKNKLIITN